MGKIVDWPCKDWRANSWDDRRSDFLSASREKTLVGMARWKVAQRQTLHANKDTPCTALVDGKALGSGKSVLPSGLELARCMACFVPHEAVAGYETH